MSCASCWREKDECSNPQPKSQTRGSCSEMLIYSHGGAFWILVCGSVFGSISCNAYDFQYFLPQEFLSDLPLREGSLALEVIQFIQSTQIPDAHHKKVDEGFISETYADSDFNSAVYREQRKVCTQVPGTFRPFCLLLFHMPLLVFSN